MFYLFITFLYTQHGIMGFQGGNLGFTIWDYKKANRSDWMVGTLLGLAFG
jgi:hypothetical protein